MSIKIDLYDLFAYTIPGGFYLFTILYLCQILNITSVDVNQINDFSAWLLIIGAAVAYAIGHIFDPLSYRVQSWFRRNIPKRNQFLHRYRARPNALRLAFGDGDQPILRAYITKHCPELADKIDKNGAIRTMLRNISLNFMFLAFVLGIHFLLTINIYLIAGILLTIAASLIAMQESLKFGRWFSDLTFQSIIALAMSSKDLTINTTKVNLEILSALLQTDTSDQGNTPKS